jgi:hypothetical protein
VKPRTQPSAVQEHGGDARRAHQVLEVGIRRRQRGVRGLHLLLARLELLVARLQLLVHREELLVRGLQLLVRRLQVLHGAFQVSSRADQLALELPDDRLGVGPEGARRAARNSHRRGLLEYEHVQAVAMAQLGHRLRREPHGKQAVRRLHRHALAHGGPARPHGLGQGGAQPDAEAAARHPGDAGGEGSRGRLEEPVGPLGQVDDVPLGRHDGIGRRKLVEDDALRDAAELRLRHGGVAARRLAERNLRRHVACGRRRPRLRAARGKRAARRLALRESLTRIHGAEQLSVPRQRLRRAEEQEAVALQRVVEEGDELLLEMRAEVDEQVAAANEVQPGEGRVRDDVVRREQAHRPQLLAHLPVPPAPHEEPREAFGGDGTRDGAEVDATPRRRQRPVVHVGREDLHGHGLGTASMASRTTIATE